MIIDFDRFSKPGAMDTNEKMIGIISKILNVETDKIKPECSFKELGADSLDIIEIIMGIEDEFKISIHDEEIDKINTVKKALDYINLRVSD